MEEFGEWYQSRDFFFELRSFDREGKGEALGSGVLWTGLVRKGVLKRILQGVGGVI